jgi:hypothetical protein
MTDESIILWMAGVIIAFVAGMAIGYFVGILNRKQRKPKKVSHSIGYVQQSQEYFVMLELRRRWMLANFDPITGKEIDGFLSFDEWIRL